MADLRNKLDKELRTKLGMLKNVGDGKKEEVDDKQKQKDKKTK